MIGMISRRWFTTRMRAGGAAFKKKKPKHGGRPNEKSKKKKKVSSSRYNGNGSLKNTSRGQGITTTTTPITSPSPHYPPFPSIHRCTSTDISNRISSRYNDDDWLVFEILNRLPVKSLTRFKTVSKRWCYLIQKDQQFIDSHLTRSRTRLPSRIFIVVPLPPTQKQEEDLVRFGDTLFYDHWPLKEFHITADLLFEKDNTKLKLVVDTVREVDSSSYDHISKPINGLVCLIDSYTEHVSRIRNISTGEVSHWFQSSSIVVGKELVSLCQPYAFGFDPATNEHKLVCVWTTMPRSSARDSVSICGVLTIGRHCSNRWRRIEEVPPDLLNDNYVYVNGVIYWSNCSLDCWASRGGYRPVYLVAFDVGSEKFRTITIPDFILDHHRVHDEHLSFEDIAQLFEVDGNLAMVLKLNNRMFNMYVYVDDDYKDKDENISGTSTSSSLANGRWREVSCITLPFNTCNNIVKFHTFIGSDDKILVSSSIWGMEKKKKKEKKKCVSIYCYNWKKDTWTKVDVSGIPSSVPQLCSHSFFTTFSESLMALNNQNAP